MTEKKKKKRERRRNVREIKSLWAVHYMLFSSDIADNIARAINIEKHNLYALTETLEWEEALDFWVVEGKARFKIPVENATEREQLCRQINSLRWAESIWTDVVRNGDDLFPSENPLPPELRSEDDDIAEFGIEALQPEELPLRNFTKHRFKIWIHDIVLAISSLATIIW